MAKQLTIFIENRPGRVNAVAGILAENGTNVLAFTVQDRGQFGLMKIIVDNPKKAQLVLEDRGVACALKDVLAIRAADKPGNLKSLTSVLLEQQVNIADAYGFVAPEDQKGMCFLELKEGDVSQIRTQLEEHGFEVLDDEELYNL